MKVKIKSKPYSFNEIDFYRSLTSRLLVVFLCIVYFVLFALPIFRYSGPSLNEIVLRGYSAISSPLFSGPYSIFMVVSLVISGLTIVAFLLQIFSFIFVNGASIVLLGLQILCFEFLSTCSLFGGYALLGVSIFNLLQYSILVKGFKSYDYWILGGVILLDLCLLPSALVFPQLFY